MRVVAAIFKPGNIDLWFCVVVCDINCFLAARETWPTVLFIQMGTVLHLLCSIMASMHCLMMSYVCEWLSCSPYLTTLESLQMMCSWNISLLSTLSISLRGTCRGRQKRVRWSAPWPAHTADSTSAKRLPPSGLVQTESRLDTHISAITSLQRRWKPLQHFLIQLWYQSAVYCLFLLSKLSGYPVNWCVDKDLTVTHTPLFFVKPSLCIL